MAKGPNAFRTISEAADELGVPQHVLRFWESRFSFIRPMKRAGGRRFYRPQDIAVLAGVRALLHGEGYTIKGVQKLHKDMGMARILAAQDGPQGPPPPTAYIPDDDTDTQPPDSDLVEVDKVDSDEAPAFTLDLTPPSAAGAAPATAARPKLSGLRPEARLGLNRALDDLTGVQARLDALLRGETPEG